ncbi:MAG: TM0106 family RecB-like putative nuclease [Chloroflexota bacterium]
MQLVDGQLIVSASDLVGFLECDHLVTLEMERTRGEREKPFRDDPQLELIQKRGYAHEQAYIARLRAEGREVQEIDTGDLKTPEQLRAAEAQTLAAMHAGVDVIFQATFFDGRWRGHADFLIRRDDRPSNLGSWSYDVADTKLARRVKAAAILQMCVYADLLERLQGIAPETVSVVTGDGVAHPHRLDDYAAYYRAAKTRFEERVAADQAVAGAGNDAAGNDAAPETYPEPVDHCRVCPWWSVCVDRRRADDHLSIVAGAARTTRRKLVDAGVPTLTALAELPEDTKVAKMTPRVLTRVRRQAALQLDHKRTGNLSYELIPPDPDQPGRGLAALPEPSPLDVFWDIEADPWAIEDGLEYLLGYVVIDAGEPAFHALWGHDREGEKAAFEAFIDLVMERLARDPAMHVYHYGGYESGAMKRLMQRHATREDEVDALLRGKVLVNLYDHVVRSGIRASVESYSIKQIEKFYLPEREGPVTSAGFSVVEYERWMESKDPSILQGIADYNRDDCVSCLGLRDWLEGLRVEAAALYPDGVVPRPGPEETAPSEAVSAKRAETRAREDALRAGIPADRALRTEEQQGRWLLAGLLDWHEREAKPQWWDYYRLLKSSMEDLVADGSALGDLEFVGDFGAIKKSRIHRYRFDPAQEFKLKVGESPIDPATGQGAGTILALDVAVGTIDLKRTGGAHPRALFPGTPYRTDTMRSSLGRLAHHVIEHGIDGAGLHRAARELILGHRPRIAGDSGEGPLVAEGESSLEAAVRIATRLDGSTLAIQGPPGTGKTWTAARMILALVREGKRVGVTAQSHKVIGNLLEAVAKAAREVGDAVRIGQRADAEDGTAALEDLIIFKDSGAAVGGIRARDVDVLGGTSWLWAREDAEAAVDVLFVDEAGQFSLANVCAVAAAADSLVLLGDPNQLPQVSNGSHPEDAEASALEHLVAGAKTIAPDRGLFLGTTYRLHPAVNAYVSDAFYEGRLETAPKTAIQSLAAGFPIGGVGIRHVPLEHSGAGNRSREEAAWVAAAIAALVGRAWTDSDGRSRKLEARDVLVVAPYNAQVAEIRAAVEKRLGVAPNVGTVDKFQGREAPVAIYSMTSSSLDDAPRDFGFLYSGNRLNVAISRAQGLAVLVCEPALLRVACHSPEQMRLVNALCRLVEVAAEQGENSFSDQRRTAPEPDEPLTLGLV